MHCNNCNTLTLTVTNNKQTVTKFCGNCGKKLVTSNNLSDVTNFVPNNLSDVTNFVPNNCNVTNSLVSPSNQHSQGIPRPSIHSYQSYVQGNLQSSVQGKPSPSFQSFQQVVQEIPRPVTQSSQQQPQDNIIDINLSTARFGDKIKPYLDSEQLIEDKVALMVDPGNRILEELEDSELNKFKEAIEKNYPLIYVTSIRTTTKSCTKIKLMIVINHLFGDTKDLNLNFRLFFCNTLGDYSFQEILA